MIGTGATEIEQCYVFPAISLPAPFSQPQTFVLLRWLPTPRMPLISSIGLTVSRTSHVCKVQRGLLHSYWAPNIWALYSCADLVLSAAATFNSSSAPHLPSLLHSLLAFAQKVLPSPRNAVSSTLGLDRAGVGMRLLPDVSAGQAAAVVIVLFLPFAFHCVRSRNNGGGRMIVSQTMHMMAATALYNPYP